MSINVSVRFMSAEIRSCLFPLRFCKPIFNVFVALMRLKTYFFISEAVFVGKMKLHLSHVVYYHVKWKIS